MDDNLKYIYGALAGAAGMYAALKVLNKPKKSSTITDEDGVWYRTPSAEGVDDMFLIKADSDIKFTGTSKFQFVEVKETVGYGKALFLDNQIQSTQFDEFVYHESLVQPAMLAHPNPKRVYIGGGGEGATLREVLRHESVEECVMVDIDDLAVQMCRKMLPEWSKGGFEDPRTKLVADDAKKILLQYPDNYFDVIIMDLCDPLDFGPCYTLYSSEFYQICHDKLTDNGVFVTQSGPSNITDMHEVTTPVYSTLKSVFKHNFAYRAGIPSFRGNWGFNIAGKAVSTGNGCIAIDDLSEATKETVDLAIEARNGGKLGDTLKYYNGHAHTHLFSQSKAEKKKLEEEERVISEKTPIYVTYDDAKNN